MVHCCTKKGLSQLSTIVYIRRKQEKALETTRPLSWHCMTRLPKAKGRGRKTQPNINTFSLTWASTFSLCQTELHRWMNDLKAWLMLLYDLQRSPSCFCYPFKTTLPILNKWLETIESSKPAHAKEDLILLAFPFFRVRGVYTLTRPKNPECKQCNAHRVMNWSALWTGFGIYGRGSRQEVVKMKSWHLNMLPIKRMKTEALPARNNSAWPAVQVENVLHRLGWWIFHCISFMLVEKFGGTDIYSKYYLLQGTKAMKYLLLKSPRN